MTRFLIIGFFLYVGLLFIVGIALTPTAWATPTHAPPAAQTDYATANSPAGNIIGMHHPRGDLEGSYSLNTPARPGFWIAVGFTGLVGVAFLITLVLFRPGNPG